MAYKIIIMIINFIRKIYIIWYNKNNSEMKTDSVTTKDRHVIYSSPLVNTKYENIWGGNWATYPYSNENCSIEYYFKSKIRSCSVTWYETVNYTFVSHSSECDFIRSFDPK